MEALWKHSASSFAIKTSLIMKRNGAKTNDICQAARKDEQVDEDCSRGNLCTKKKR